MNAKPTARTRLQPAERRAQLLRCAISAFAEHGVARATHAHVARRAGVSVAAVHSYFRTRDDLVMATLDVVEAKLLAIVMAIDIKRLSATETLSTIARDFDAAARHDPDVIKVWLDWGTGFRDEVWPRYRVMQERVYEQVRRALARGKRLGELSPAMNVMAATRLFVGGGHTIVLMRLAGAGEREIATLIDHLVKSVISIGREADSTNGRRARRA